MGALDQGKVDDGNAEARNNDYWRGPFDFNRDGDVCIAICNDEWRVVAVDGWSWSWMLACRLLAR